MTTASARRTFEILRVIGGVSSPISVADLCQRLQLPLTTAHRALNTLVQSGYVEFIPSLHRYGPGPNCRGLVHSFCVRNPLYSIAIPHMYRLVVMTGESVSLFSRVGWYTVRVATITGTSEVVHSGPRGESWHLEDHVSGIAMLAHAAPGFRETFLAARREAARIADDFDHMMNRVKVDGYLIESVRGRLPHLAVPVVSADDQALAAIVVEATGSQPQTWEQERLEAITAQVRFLSEIVSADAEMYRIPYDHIPPSKIVLPANSKN